MSIDAKNSLLHPVVWPQAVLFDWDNTLLDSCALTLHGLNAVRSYFALDPLTRACMHRLPATSLRDLFGQWLKTEADIMTGQNLFHHTIKGQRSPLFPLTTSVLEWLKDKSVPMAVVSNKEGDLLRREVEHWKVNHLFQTVIGAGDTTQNKPSPQPVWHALEHMGIAPSARVWFVGDSMIDMEAAHGAGSTPISLCQQSEKSPRPKHHVNHLEGFSQLLHSCWQNHQS
jgi:phosphoglycolate phosphatase